VRGRRRNKSSPHRWRWQSKYRYRRYHRGCPGCSLAEAAAAAEAVEAAAAAVEVRAAEEVVM